MRSVSGDQWSPGPPNCAGGSVWSVPKPPLSRATSPTGAAEAVAR
jgi:hypothetical protein